MKGFTFTLQAGNKWRYRYSCIQIRLRR